MSRLKLILLVSIVAMLGIVFVQNREPLALKLLCPDRAALCLYQTPSLPLAIWMALFIAAGVITSLLSQLFNRYRYSGGRKRADYDDFPKEQRDSYEGKAQQSSDRSDKYPASTEKIDRSTVEDKYTPGNYETLQKPEKVERSGSNYSYKYRDVKGESNSSSKKSNNSEKSSIDSEIDLNKDDEDWI